MDPVSTAAWKPVSTLSDEILAIAGCYPSRGPRESLDAVRRLRQTLPPLPPPLAVGVVGTNGKTSTATYLARLLTASGLRTGLYVSPHLADWRERVRIDGAPCELSPALATVHELAQSSSDARDLRFFDILTLAAERIFAVAGAAVGVFEAGIGGRLDAIAALQPPLVLLTSVARDHTEILGDELGEVLEEKLLVAPAGATVMSFRLGAELEEIAADVARRGGFRMSWVDGAQPELRDPAPDLPAYLRSALVLAEAGRRACGNLLGGEEGAVPAASATVDLWLPGRLEHGERNGVPYVLDAAHNEAAWRKLAAELSRPSGVEGGSGPIVALLSVSPEKHREDLPGALRALPDLHSAVVTRHTALPAEDPRQIAAELSEGGIEATAVDDAEEAVDLAFARAAGLGGKVLVFGSTHLVGEVRGLLGLKAG
jgi:dihydrofolate synthase / folylpolyglutamate synthase